MNGIRLLLLVCLTGCIKYNVNGTLPRIYAIADRSNSRVLLFNGSPSNGQLPSVVLGQPDFVSNTANSGGISASTLNFPDAVVSDGIHVVVSDSSNNRILIWNSIPKINDQPADVVIGQSNFTSSSANAGGTTAANTLSFPIDLALVGGRLYVVDRLNQRVLIYNSLPATNFKNADLVLGQPNFTSNGVADSATGMRGPQDVSSDGAHLFVSNWNGNKIQIWNEIPSYNQQPADIVVLQPSFSSILCGWYPGGSGAPTAYGECGGGATVACSGALISDDFSYNRVLIWNSIPQTNGQPANIVLGQPDMTHSTANNTPGAAGTVSSQSLNGPNGVSCWGRKLFVSDTGNNRVLVWNSLPTVNQQPADQVIGQPNFSSNSSSVTPTGLNASWGFFDNVDFFGINRPGGY